MKEKFMKAALKEAQKAKEKGEVPIGAVIVKEGQIISRGHNQRETTKDPLAHAELIAIRKAAKKIGDWRLLDCSMYVTLEPCPMCAGAIILSRVETLVVGAMDPKGGAVGSKIDLLDEKIAFNHRVKVEKNYMEKECSQILKDFFKELRVKKKEEGKYEKNI